MTAAAPLSTAERLHKFSWLFVMLAQLGNLIFPLMLLIFAGRAGSDDRWEIGFGIVGAALLSAYSLFYTLTFRFWVEAEEIIVKEGLFDRTLRHVPFTRIQNVSFKQNLLHRLMGVVEINLESGAGVKPEARLTVLPLARAKRLEQEIRGRATLIRAEGAPLAQSTAQMDATLLHHVGLGELIRLGLISNRGMILIGTAFYFLSQTRLFPTNVFKQIGQWVRDHLGVVHGPLFWLATVLISFFALLVVVRLASIGMAIFSYFDFKLFAGQGSLRVEHGLVTRQGGSTKPSGVVAMVVKDGWLYRLFNRQTLNVVLPGALMENSGNGSQSGMRHLTPIAHPNVINLLVQKVRPIDLATLQLHPIHPLAWKRMVKWPLILLLVSTTVAVAFLGYLALNALAWVTAAATLAMASVWVYGAIHDARASGFALTRHELIVRTGYFSQHTSIIPRAEVQSVSISETPFDVRHQMAHVRVDLRSGSLFEIPEVVVRYLPKSIAIRLAAALRSC
jgi:putative membrane protein